MQRFELELSTVTPAFIGTADPAKSAEWTAKSVRGQLRWWLRAVLGGELGGRQDEVRAAEEAIFGSTKRKSAVRIMVRPCASKDTSSPQVEGGSLDHVKLADKWGNKASKVLDRLELKSGASNPIAWLGFGPIEKNRYARARIEPGQKLHLLMQWNGRTPPPESLGTALWCWLNLGGIGGRSRRGFGSLACNAVHASAGGESLIAPADTVENFKAAMKKHLAGARQASPIASWSHFTTGTQIYISTKAGNDWSWQEAMTAAGAWLIAFRRRYGISTDERDTPGNDVRNHDYVWLKSKPPIAHKTPDRAGFGLPLPFGKPKELVAAWRRHTGNEGSEKQQTGRRASPLLIHVSRFGNDHRVVFTHMPAQLIPDNAEIHFRGTHAKASKDQEEIIGKFLDDLATKKKIEVIAP